MNDLPARRLSVAVFAALSVAAPAWNQTPVPTPTPLSDFARLRNIPEDLWKYVGPLGDRLRAPGKERLVMTAVLTEAGRDTNVELIYEFPGRLSVRETGPAGRVLTLAGQDVWAGAGNPSQRDEDLLESFGEDSAEGFFEALLQGAALRRLGGRFRTEDGRAANYRGPWHDIFEVTGQARAARARGLRPKTYHFDSETRLLWKARYRRAAAAGGIVETVFTDWRTVNGQAAPHQIERSENGVRALVLRVTGVNILPKAGDNVFVRPR